MVWDAIVIGGGLGGLTAGALCAKAGKRVLLVEKNAALGGAATCFTRNGRRFEVSLHETTHPFSGADPKGRIFRELGLAERVTLIPVPELYRVSARHLGLDLVLPHGLDPLQRTLTRAFPEDARGLDRFLAQIERTQRAIAVFMERHDGAWWRMHIRDLPRDLWAVLRDLRHTLSEVMNRDFGDNEALKLALCANLFYYTDDPDTFWWLAYAVAQGGYQTGGGYYVHGGSAALSAALAEVIADHGGEIRTRCAATEIRATSTGSVSGVQLEDGTQHSAPVVFGNAAPQVLAGLLPDALGEALRVSLGDRKPSISLFEASIALDRPGRDLGITTYSTALLPPWMTRLSDFTRAGTLPGDMPLKTDPPVLVVDYGQIDSGLAQDTSGPVSVTGIDRLANWDGLSEDDYREQKSTFLARLIGQCDAEWPGFAAAVVSADLATARTMAHHLGTPEGAVYGFAPERPRLRLPGPKGQVHARTVVPGLWLASAWAGFGGYTGAMGSGAMAASMALSDMG